MKAGIILIAVLMLGFTNDNCCYETGDCEFCISPCFEGSGTTIGKQEYWEFPEEDYEVSFEGKYIVVREKE